MVDPRQGTRIVGLKRAGLSQEALAAIKQAHQQETPQTEAGAKAMHGSIYILTIPKLSFPLNVRVSSGKQGEDRYWLGNQPKGPGMTEHPLLVRLATREEAFLDECMSPKERKREGLRKATVAASEARTARSKALAMLQALSEAKLHDRTACARISEQFNVKPAYVRKLRAKRASP